MANAFSACFANLGNLRSASGEPLAPETVETLREVFRKSVIEARQKGISLDEAIRGAPAAARKAIELDAAAKQYRVAQEILALTKTQDYVKANAGVHRNEADSLIHMTLEQDDLKQGIASIDNQADGIYQTFSSGLLKALDNVDSKFFGLIEDKVHLRGLLGAMYGEKTDPKMSQGAKAWGESAEQLRVMANRLGAKIGKVSDIYIPQGWNAIKVGDVGRSAWAKFMFDHVDRSRHLNDFGEPLSDAEMMSFLEAAWTNVSAVAQVDATRGGVGGIANRGAQSREIHLKDADSWLTVNQHFGDGSLANMMDAHLRSMSRQIAVMRQFGPSPPKTMQAILDAGRERLKDDAEGLRKFEDDAKTAVNALNWVMNNKPILTAEQLKIQGVFRNLKALQLAKLGFAPITSLTDNASVQVVAHLNGMSGGEAFINQMKRLNPLIPSERALMVESGILAQVHLEHAYNWGEQTLKSSFVEKLGNAQMTANLLNYMTKARRESFAKMAQNHMGRWTRKPWAELGGRAQMMIKDSGITELDWQVMGKAKTVDWGNGETILGPQAILAIPDADLKALGDPQTLRENAIVNYMAYITREGKRAVLEPSENSRRKMFQWIEGGRGTVLGELGASMMQFKSFPVAMLMQNMRRAASVPGNAKYAYLGALVLTQTLAGAVVIQSKEMLRGKDPRNMNDWRFWMASFLAGGSFGLYVDFLFAPNARSAGNLAEAAIGPVLGTTARGVGATFGLARRAAEGDNVKPLDQATRIAAGMIPFYNWYTGAFLDHLLLQNLFEATNPGYLRRMEKRARTDFGQSYYYKPGELLPERAPDLSAAWVPE